MSQNYSEDVTSNYHDDGQAEWSNASTGVMSPTFSTSPSLDNAFMHGWVADDVLTSPAVSPRLSAYGSSCPASFPAVDLNNSFGTDQSHDIELLSHSVPHEYHSHSSQITGHLSFHQIEEQEEYESFPVDMIYNQEDPVFITHSFTQSIPPTGLSHMPQSWVHSQQMARTNSVITSNSAGSANSGRGFDDFHDEADEETVPSIQIFAPLAIKQEPPSRGRAWSNSADSTVGSVQSRATSAIPVPAGKGRKGKLTAEQRAAAAMIRKIGACKMCRTRRAKCDLNIPCMACRRYYRNNTEGLAENPCRGEELSAFADQILAPNAFPKGSYERFLEDGFRVEPTEHEVSLDLGFGNSPFRCRVRLVRANSQLAYMHDHVEYPWQPVPGESNRNIRRDAVFPAILADSSATAAMVEHHLNKVLESRAEFQYFPLWRSDLKILKHIYKYYLSLSSHGRTPLAQALQLLILIHVGGDIRVIHDDLVEAIIQKYLPNCYGERIIPCFIRAQLGPIFSNIAFKLMREVLKALELLSPIQDPKLYPMVICTFSVLFMAMESLQYHFDKVGFHCHHDNPSQMYNPQRARDSSTFQRSDILLRFYQSTICHSQLGFLSEPDAYIRFHQSLPASSTNRQSNRRDHGGSSTDMEMHRATVFMDSLYSTLREARPYLKEKVKTKLADADNDLSAFFDCLLAKMFMKGAALVSN